MDVDLCAELGHVGVDIAGILPVHHMFIHGAYKDICMPMTMRIYIYNTCMPGMQVSDQCLLPSVQWCTSTWHTHVRAADGRLIGRTTWTGKRP